MPRSFLLLLTLVLGAQTAWAQPVNLETVQAGRFDNGKMWTFDHPPMAYLQEAYGMQPDQAWFTHARLAALRVPGCSASFVSAQGLVMTNHHCARNAVTSVQSEGEDFITHGYYAQSTAEERRIPNYYADMLVAITDVTAEIDAAQAEAQTAAERASARQQAIADITSRLQEEAGAGHVVQVISLYNGSRFSAYTFRRFDDVRLVMTPELNLGYFGGDPDNFTYPRYALDMTFYRVYVNDQPYQPQYYYRWSDNGAQENEPVFVVGNPGSTNRLESTALLQYRGDVAESALLGFLRETIAQLEAEYARTPSADLLNRIFSLRNGEKLYTGRVKGLTDPYLMARRRAAERDFQTALAERPALQQRYGTLIADLEALTAERQEIVPHVRAFAGFAPGSPNVSATLSRALIAVQYHAQGRPERLRQAMSRVPEMSAELDAGLFAARRTRMHAAYGDHTLFRVAGLPNQCAPLGQAIVAQSVFANPETAMAALDNMPENDPAVIIAREINERWTAFQSANAGFNARQTELLADLGRARFAIYGFNEPPDATFSLRLADGRVQGYTYNGTIAPPFTTFFGLYDRAYSHGMRAEGADVWELPARWQTPPAGLNLATPVNFVSTNDIIGGNSGSPVVNANLEIVGLVFDGNIESLPSSFIYTTDVARAVSVDSRGMIESLQHVYGMQRIVNELRAAVPAR